MKIKKIISGIMAVLVVAGAVPAFGTNPVQDYAVTASDSDYGTYGKLTYAKYSDSIEIIDCAESAEKVIIPGAIEGLPVKYIGTYAFQDCSSVLYR